MIRYQLVSLKIEPLFGPLGTTNGPPAPTISQKALTATRGIQAAIQQSLEQFKLSNNDTLRIKKITQNSCQHAVYNNTVTHYDNI